MCTGAPRMAQRRTFLTRTGGPLLGDRWHMPVLLASAAVIGLGVIGFGAYAMFYGPGSHYPGPVRKLLREAGKAYMRPPGKQDLPAALEKYTEALQLLDELGSTDLKHAPDAPHVTGLVARIGSVYWDMGDLDGAISAYTDLLRRILGEQGMEDARTQVRRLMDPELPVEQRQNILRALGCANKLAEAYEAREARTKRRSALRVDGDMGSADVQAASRWYQWCLQLVMLTYQNHYNHQRLENNQPPVSTPSFEPDTLPRFFSVDIVTSLFYNAAAFFAAHAQYSYAVPLLQRALDLMRGETEKGTETCVCRSSVLMSHMANASVQMADLPAAERWSIEGLALAKRFPANSDCLNSFIALTYDLGIVYEAAAKPESARVQFRQAIEVASAVGDADAERLASTALQRVGGTHHSAAKQ
ncbi:hypothetical protein GGI07_002350 [Coemansia sp. Benny D115]|nr:hypothetical protein GGI07_002350 [Coemansia sp. Benny D115]